ncbi:MAG TPA: hypothetical protein ENJ84_07785 [Gammaproteobacteria bacterium]|nr:hypothetical protein [Gammaproteobacteria bacterium]
MILNLIDLSNQMLAAARENNWQRVKTLDTERQHQLKQLDIVQKHDLSNPELLDHIKILRDIDQCILTFVKQARDSARETHLNTQKTTQGISFYQQQP